MNPSGLLCPWTPTAQGAGAPQGAVQAPPVRGEGWGPAAPPPPHRAQPGPAASQRVAASPVSPMSPVPQEHLRMNKLQAVPRGQLQSFPMRAPFRTAHGSPGSHCGMATVSPGARPPRLPPPGLDPCNQHPPPRPYQWHPAQPFLHRRQLPAPQFLQHLLQRLDLPQTARCHPEPPGTPRGSGSASPRVPWDAGAGSCPTHEQHPSPQVAPWGVITAPYAWLVPAGGELGLWQDLGGGARGTSHPLGAAPHPFPNTHRHPAQHLPSPHRSQSSPSGQDREGKNR